MTVHLIKLCVGVDTVKELADWQSERLKRLRRAGKTPELCHRTLQAPRRRAEVLDGGSLYWVIKGNVQCRQPLLEIRPFIDGEGIGRCHLMLEPVVVPTQWQPRRAFQGWRYLKPSDAPVDLGKNQSAILEMPQQLRRELAELGLL
jgi:hypothetical protein